MPYDPSAYRGTAAYYAAGRPPYSLALSDTLANEVEMDGYGRMLDVGGGPGVLTVELAPRFGEAVALDPDPGMLAEGRSRAEESFIWGNLKSSELANLCPDTIEEAAVYAEDGLTRIGADAELAFAFLGHCGLKL